MTKYLLPICVCLSSLALLVGCEGTPSAPTPHQPQVIQPVERPPEPITRAEPNEPQLKPQSRVPEPNETKRVEVDKQAPAEPNEPPAVIPHSALRIPQSAAPLNPQSEIRNPQSMASFLKSYAELLESYVHEEGVVDYADLRRRRLELKPLLMELSELDPNSYAGWSNDEKLAFWINVYNLKMLEIIARNYPIQSSRWLRLTWPPSDIRHITGIRTDYKFIVLGEEFTLAEVEQRFLHRTFSEPRAFLALSYACRSGPPLRRKPYDGEHLAQQLDEQVKAFLAGPQGLQIDRRTMTVRLSAVFKPAWRGKEFVARYGTDKKFKDRDAETRAVLNFLTGYLSRDDAYFLETENYTLEYINFDWRLNDSSRGY